MAKRWPLRGFSVILTLVLVGTTFAIKIPVGAIFDTSDGESLQAIQRGFGGQLVREGSPVTFDLKTEKVDSRDSYQVFQAASRLLKKNILTLIVPSTSGGYSILPSLSSNVQVPVVSLSERPLDEESRDDYVIYIKPDTLRATLDVMRFYRWSNVIYLYNREDGPERLQYLQHLGSSALQLNIAGLQKIRSGDRLTPIGRRLGTGNNFLIDASEEAAEKILKTAELEGQQMDTHYLLINPVSDSFWTRNKDFETLNITSFRLSAVSFKEAELNSEKSQTALCKDAAKLTSDALSRFANSHAELIESSRNYYNNSSASRFPHGNLVKQFLVETLLADGETGSVQLDQSGQRRGFTLSAVETWPNKTREAFTWTDPTGLKVISPTYAVLDQVSRVTASIRNKIMVISTTAHAPYVILEKDADGKITNMSGFIVDLVGLIGNVLGFNYKLQLSADGSYGTKDSSGLWNGMIGEVIRRDVDMAVSDLTITTARADVVDFTTPFLTVGISMMVKKPGSQSSGRTTSPYFFLYVFTLETWCCIIVAFIGVGVLYYFVARLTSVNFDPRTGAKRELGVLSSLWYSFAGLTLRNVGIYPKSISTRFLSAIWWLFVLVILAIYVGGLITALLVNVFGNSPSGDDRAIFVKSPENIIRESLEKGYPKIGLIAGGSTNAFFKNSNVDPYLRLGKHLTDHPEDASKSNAEGISRVKKGNGNYVFLMESSSNEFHSNRHCDLAMIPKLLDSKGYGIALPKGSPYTNLINSALLRLHENGDILKLRHYWWKKNDSCIADDGEWTEEQTEENELRQNLSYTPLSLWDISGLFYCLITGIILSLLVSVGEYFIKRRKRGNHSVDGFGAVRQA